MSTDRIINPRAGLLAGLAASIRSGDGPAGAAAASSGTREIDEAELPIPIRGPDAPDGVPMHDVLAVVKQVAPSVAGLAIRGGRTTVTHDREPSAEERAKLAELLADGNRLLEQARAARRPDPEAPDPELVRVLLDDSTADDKWLRSFRRYAVAHLISQGRE